MWFTKIIYFFFYIAEVITNEIKVMTINKYIKYKLICFVLKYLVLFFFLQLMVLTKYSVTFVFGLSIVV